MLFKESFITNSGAELLARAIGQQGKLIWTRAFTSSHNVNNYTVEEMNSLVLETFGTFSSGGFITNAIVNDSQTSVSIFSELNNMEASGYAYLYGALAKIEGDENETLVIVARCGEGVTPSYINSYEEGLVKAFVDFSLQISPEQAQAIEVSEANYYATSAALQEEQMARQSLANRVVTTHSLENEAEGDNQDVYGVKTFHDTTKFKLTELSSEGQIQFIPTNELRTCASIGAQYSNGEISILKSSVNIYGSSYGPSIEESVDLSGRTPNSSVEISAQQYPTSFSGTGPKIKLYNEIDEENNTTYGKVYVSAKEMSFTTMADGLSPYCVISSGSFQLGNVSLSSEGGDLVLTPSQNGGIIFNGNVGSDIVLVDGSVLRAGQISVSESSLSLSGAEISFDNDNLVVSSSNSIILNDHTEALDGLYVEGNFSAIDGLSCGGESSFMGAITADSGITSHGDIIVDNGKKFVGNLNGVIPYVESSNGAVPIGCIVLLRVKYLSAYTAVFSAGSLFKSDSSEYELSIGCFTDTGINANNSSTKLGAGLNFRALSQCLFANNTVTHVLAIRVA